MSKSYQQSNINLEESMTMELMQSVRVWLLQGIHIQNGNIPENANFQKTFVMKRSKGQFLLGVNWKLAGELMTHMDIVVKVSTLEELKDKFPNLFELEGSLYAFA